MKDAIRRVSDQYGLPADWLNADFILSTVKELLMLGSSYPLTVEDAAYILEEDPLELHEIIKENQSLLSLDEWKEPYLTVRALFRLATFLPKNPIAQECVYQLLNIALK